MAELEASVLTKLAEFFEPSNGTADPPTGPTTEDPFFQDEFFHPSLIADSEPCKAILHYHVGSSNLRLWDLLILVPNLAFLLFLFYRLPSTRLKLRATNSQLYRTLYTIVLTCSLVSALRCLLAMMVHLDSTQHDLANKGFWVTSRFILLTAELAVATFGGAFGVMDSKQAVGRICLAAALVSFLVCGLQAYLEIFQPFYGFKVLGSGVHLYGHGGPIYWAVTSCLLALLYLLLLLSLTCPSCLLPSLLPHSSSFTVYCSIQLAIHAASTAGAAMLAANIHSGLCITNMTSFASFSLLSPLIFTCFLSNWFATSQPGLLFAYKAQLDDMDEDASIQTSSSIQSFRQEEQDAHFNQASFVNEPIHNTI